MILLDTNVLPAVMRREPADRPSLATRNLRHFEGLGVDLVDPWSA